MAILDPALLRLGRFDRQVLVDRTDTNGQEAILEIHSKNVPLDELAHLVSQKEVVQGEELRKMLGKTAVGNSPAPQVSPLKDSERQSGYATRGLTCFGLSGDSQSYMIKHADSARIDHSICCLLMGGCWGMVVTNGRFRASGLVLEGSL